MPNPAVIFDFILTEIKPRNLIIIHQQPDLLLADVLQGLADRTNHTCFYQNSSLVSRSANQSSVETMSLSALCLITTRHR